MVVFKHEYHIEIFQAELNSFEMNQFHIFQRDHKWGLSQKQTDINWQRILASVILLYKTTYPFG